MKKKIFCITLSVFLIICLSGCAKGNEFEVGEKSDIEIFEKDVTMSIKEDTLTNTGATLILKSNENIDVEYGTQYNIEIYQDDSWHKINVELDFVMVAYILKSKESKEIEINWENGYGKLAKGKYRIIKSISIPISDGSFSDYFVAAEFNVK